MTDNDILNFTNKELKFACRKKVKEIIKKGKRGNYYILYLSRKKKALTEPQEQKMLDWLLRNKNS